MNSLNKTDSAVFLILKVLSISEGSVFQIIYLPQTLVIVLNKINMYKYANFDQNVWYGSRVMIFFLNYTNQPK